MEMHNTCANKLLF